MSDKQAVAELEHALYHLTHPGTFCPGTRFAFFATHAHRSPQDIARKLQALEDAADHGRVLDD